MSTNMTEVGKPHDGNKDKNINIAIKINYCYTLADRWKKRSNWQDHR